MTSDAIRPPHCYPLFAVPPLPCITSHQTHGLSYFDGQTWTTYTEDDGLAGNNVMSMAPDCALWFGTSGGVSRYLPPD